MRKSRATLELDGNAIRTQRTRSRILAEALVLFNRHGEARVTTASIAAALGISPGNLYYHFRNKDAIVAELFRAFAQRIDVPPRVRGPAAEAVEDLWLYLHLMLEAIWDYRFLYRDLDGVLARNRGLHDAFARILERKHESMVALCDSLVAAGAMRARPAEIRALARNVLVIATYWLEFAALRGGSQRREPVVALGEGAFQVMALVAPYLRGDARRPFERLALRYLD